MESKLESVNHAVGILNGVFANKVTISKIVVNNDNRVEEEEVLTLYLQD